MAIFVTRWIRRLSWSSWRVFRLSRQNSGVLWFGNSLLCLGEGRTSRVSFFERSSPHPRSDALLLLADGIRVDRCRGELGMAEPLLHHIEGDAPADSLTPKPWRMPLGQAWGPSGMPAAVIPPAPAGRPSCGST